MKKTLLIVVAVVMMMIFSANVFAAEEEKVGGWKPFAEISATAHSSYLDDYSGSRYYEKFTFVQSTIVGLDKNDAMGIYVQSENFFPFGKNEYEETDLYIAFYAKFYGVKIDTGFGRYWIWKNGECDYNGIFAEVTFPSPFFKIVPFVKGEYRFADKKGEDEDGNEFSQNGFLYMGGLKREFQLHERVNLTAKISFGGHTGIYGMPAENLSFAREELELEILVTEWLKIKGSAATQQNLGRRDGIAANTNILFVSGGIGGTF